MGEKASQMADWLALHDVTPDFVTAILSSQAPVEQPPKRPLARTDLSGELVWKIAANACGQAIPEGQPMIAAVVENTRRTFTPDTAKYPRAFTLHDAGDGWPFVSCPYSGRLSDALAVGHEFGHAFQVCATKPRDMAPVLRETCAFLSEAWLAAQLDRFHTQHGVDANHLWAKQRAEFLGPNAKSLINAAQSPGEKYNYRWNYPVAFILAQQIFEQGNRFDPWALFQGRETVRSLWRGLNR